MNRKTPWLGLFMKNLNFLIHPNYTNMKKISFLLAGLLFIVFSCNDKEDDNGEGGMSARAKKNLDAVHAVNDAIKTGDVSKLDSFLTEDAVDHAGNMERDIVGRDSIKKMLASIHTMANNMETTIIKELADDEYVFQWMRIKGVTATPDWGMPVGTAFENDAIQVTRHVADGRAAEHWEFMLPKQFMQMMQNMGPPADTTKQK
jgi:hypothetical protein